MGRALFQEFIGAPSGAGKRGIRISGAFASWETLLARGRDRAVALRRHGAYLVDPARGLESFVSLFAVGLVPDTFLLWARPAPDFGSLTEVAPALYAVEGAANTEIGRPLWGILTSGTSGNAKVPVGYADTLELVVLHYDTVLFQTTFADGGEVGTLATCLPLQFSAAFFMTVLPALFLRRDLVVFEPHDWRPLYIVATRERVICQSVPSVTAAGLHSIEVGTDASNAALFLGGGHVTQRRVDAIRERLPGITVNNIYGTAETGAVAIDRAPGHGTYVGRPFAGKPVWIDRAGHDGVGFVTTAGNDCRSFYWDRKMGLAPLHDTLASSDFGHFDEAGNLYLDARVDQGEKLHGITIYTRSVERHILQLRGVVDARVYIEHGDDGSEVLAARVVGSALPEEVRQHCESLSAILRPRSVSCVLEDDAAAVYTTHGKL